MIKDIEIARAWNNRGEETLKVYVRTESGIFSAYAPSGKSKGRWELSTLDIEQALKLLPDVKKNFIGLDEKDWDSIDSQIEQIYGRNFEKCGANFACALSMAVARAASGNEVYRLLGGRLIFPYPLGNVIGGGAHMGSTAIQEFLIVPLEAKNIFDAIKTNIEVWKEVGTVLNRARHTGRNDEGAWISGLDDVKTLDVLVDIAEGHGVRVGIDIAASQMFIKGKYRWAALKKEFDIGEQLEFIRLMVEKYKLFYVEDPFQENDFAAFEELKKKVNCIICGDDLYASQPLRISQGAHRKATDAAIIKIDQAGTLSRALRAVDACRNGNIEPIISHRSGETCDDFISDLTVGISGKFIKCGIGGGERVAKLNRLIEIWEQVSRTGKPEMAKLRFNL